MKNFVNWIKHIPSPESKLLMLKRFWHKLSFLGIEGESRTFDKGNIIYTNQLLLILTSVSLLLGILVGIRFGWYATSHMILISVVFYVAFLTLNSLGYTKLSRLLTCIFLPFYVLAVSIVSKQTGVVDVEPYEYFEFRFLILVSPMIPITVFNYQRKIWLYSGLLPSFITLIVFDPLHELFGIGYEQVGFIATNYGFTNIVLTIAYFLLVFSLIFIKIITSNLEKDKENLIVVLDQKNQELIKKNSLLKDLNDEVNQQNEEITAQSEELKQNQEALHQNHLLITSQAKELAQQNKHLETEILTKNNNLLKTNKELIQHNNELRQFSYTISHNLRGPVASLIGLVNIFEEDLNKHNLTVVNHIKDTTNVLDSIIKDLSKVIQIKNSIYEVKESVSFDDEVSKIKGLISDTIQDTKANIITNFSLVPEIYSVKAFISSILYNLISNSIKYRSTKRQVIVELSSRKEGDYIIIQVKDNGLGINLEDHRSELFKLYKRFHTHIEGKGLGLYLVNLQAEMLKGKVEIESVVNEGSMFSVYVKNEEPDTIKTYFENEYALIFHDTNTNAGGIKWKKKITSKIYRDLANIGMQLIKKEKTPNWISDWRYQSSINRDDQIWMLEQILPEAQALGLKQIIIIVNEQKIQSKSEYIQYLYEKGKVNNLVVKILESFEEAVSWLLTTTEIDN